MTKTTCTRRNFLSMLAIGAAGVAGSAALAACAQDQDTTASGTASGSATAAVDVEPVELANTALAIDTAAWNYDADNDVYYQIGVAYCAAPQAADYESMGIFVPGAYMDATDNGDGTFTCTVNDGNEVNGFTGTTAPIVMPINTAGYSAQAAPTEYSYSGLGDYLEAGLIYVYAGCRGRDNGDTFAGGAPWGVTDLKSAVRTLRYNGGNIPGDKDRIFSFGHSGGGAQSAILGATGNAEGYTPYLETIGAALQDDEGNDISDAIMGAMCWCPITNLDYANEAYEWNMGQFASSGTRAEGTFTAQLSQDMAEAYADYINVLGLRDADGNELTLEDGGEGIKTQGSYYDYVVAEVERSLNNFLADTEFPYTPSNAFNADMGAAGGGSGAPSGEMPGEAPSGEAPSGEAPSGEAPSGGAPGAMGGSSDSEGSGSTTYETVEDYIAELNGDSEWITYDSGTNTASISGLVGFVNACKSPSKDVCAFDALDRSQAENKVFGTGDEDALHFDFCTADLLLAGADTYAELEGWDSSYPDEYAADLEKADELGNLSEGRQNLYNPMYYLCPSYDGEGTSVPAPHWRIRTGIEQGDTASATEINLALALQQAAGVESVDFETVWGQGHTTAERTGDSTSNFISWVQSCCA